MKPCSFRNSILSLCFQLGIALQVGNTEVTFTGRPIQPLDTLSLWYVRPATTWMTQALALGNGQSGAMVFGGVQQERIQFNEKTLWTGSPTDYGFYQNFGNINLDFPGLITVSDYRRDLSLKTALATVSYKVGQTAYLREYFFSYPDQVMVMRFTSSGTGNISFTANVVDAHTGTKTATDGRITIAGKLTLVSYEAQLLIRNEGGTITTSGTQVTVSGADAATIYLACGTDYSASAANYLTGNGVAGIHTTLNDRMVAASAKSYPTLKANHVSDYQTFFQRMTLNLNHGYPNSPTDSLMAKYKQGVRNPLLEVLIFQLGRYLTIAGSRPGVLIPTNLQGIWNDKNDPGWSSDFHGDINVEMNYFGTELSNLAELARPYTDWIHNEAVNHTEWKKYATNLGNQGWVIYAQNNIFGESNWGNLWGQGAWLCMDLWKHYAFTLDTAYLATIAYPAMKGSADFWISRLKLASDGTLVSPNTSSPEHGPTEDGVSFDQQLIWDLLTNTIEASRILNLDASYRTTLTSTLAKLDPGLHIGSFGQLREWKYTNDSPTDTHRHQSYAIALYPGNQLLPLAMPDLAKAIKVTLDARGDGGDGGNGYGWDHAWKIALRARLFDGNHAFTLLQKLFTDGDFANNLFDIYGNTVFQIDANFGTMAGMAEMLLQSQAGFIHLLPALPDAWPVGNEKGLCARNAFEVDMDWSAKVLNSASILSKKGKLCSVKYEKFSQVGAYVVVDVNGAAIPFTRNGDIYTFNTVPGGRYRIGPPSLAMQGTKQILHGTLNSEKLFAGTRLVIPGFESGTEVEVSIYSLSGKLQAKVVTRNPTIDLQAELGMKDEVRIIRFKRIP